MHIDGHCHCGHVRLEAEMLPWVDDIASLPRTAADGEDD
jgi:hypothetical protein